MTISAMNNNEASPFVEVLLKRIYGNERFYPVSKDANVVCELLNAKTLTKDQLKVCRDNGWRVTIKSEDYDLG